MKKNGTVYSVTDKQSHLHPENWELKKKHFGNVSKVVNIISYGSVIYCILSNKEIYAKKDPSSEFVKIQTPKSKALKFVPVPNYILCIDCDGALLASSVHFNKKESWFKIPIPEKVNDVVSIIEKQDANNSSNDCNIIVTCKNRNIYVCSLQYEKDNPMRFICPGIWSSYENGGYESIKKFPSYKYRLTRIPNVNPTSLFE